MTLLAKLLLPQPRTTPGDLLYGVAPVTALVLLVFNDFWFKGRGPSVLTGKLSDVAGLFLFPLVLLAVLECIRWLVDRDHWWFSDRVLAMCVVATMVVFSLIKISEPAGEAYQVATGVLQWPVSTAVDLLTGTPVRAPRRVGLVQDRTDLLTLPAAALSYLYARKRLVPQPKVEAG